MIFKNSHSVSEGLSWHLERSVSDPVEVYSCPLMLRVASRVLKLIPVAQKLIFGDPDTDLLTRDYQGYHFDL
jgi:hypothetical protein